MRGILDLGTIPLSASGKCADENRRISMEKGQREIESYLEFSGIPENVRFLRRAHVYVIGTDEVRVTIPAARHTARPMIPEEKKVTKGSEAKRDDNVGRAMRTVYDLIKCNPWEHFCTQTIDAGLLDRTDLHGLIGTMSRGIADQNKRVIHVENKIRYLWVPELHADGKTWHLHGVMSGLTEKDLRRNKNGFLEWSWSRDNVGFFSLDRIRSREKTASYIRKYITKNVETGGHEKGVHLYYCSKGLERPVHMRPDDEVQTADLASWVKQTATYARQGEWADTYTLQGKAAETFRETWGEQLTVLPRVRKGRPRKGLPVWRFFCMSHEKQE